MGSYAYKLAGLKKPPETLFRNCTIVFNESSSLNIVNTEIQQTASVEFFVAKLNKRSIHDRNKRRKTENSGIDYSKAHFDALEVNFKVAVNIHEALARLKEV